MRFVSATMILLLVGCGGSSDRPKLAPVAGVVMKGDKPLADVIVTFHLEGGTAPRLPMGKTDASGKFRLTSYDTNDGAMIGTHIVTVVKVEAKDQGGEMEIGGADYDAAMSAAANPNAAPPKQLLPEIYATKETSPLRITVEEAGKTDAKIIIE